MARVMEDYAMQEPGELTLPRGGIVNVYEIIDDEWSRGELNGKVGRYPSKVCYIFPIKGLLVIDFSYSTLKKLICLVDLISVDNRVQVLLMHQNHLKLMRMVLLVSIFFFFFFVMNTDYV